MGEVVVGVDESEGAAQALRWATRESDLRGWDLTAVLAWGFFDQHHTIVGERFDPAYGEQEAAEALTQIVSRAVGADSARRVRLRVACELPAHALLDASAGAELLVVGARGTGGFTGLMLGSISQQCLHHSMVPIAIVRGEPVAVDQKSRIVVAVDGSDTAHRALTWALDHARAQGSKVTAVHAWDPPYILGDSYMHVAVDPGVFADASRRLLAAAVQGADTSDLPSAVEQISIRGGAAAAIIEAAASADLIVMGSRGLGGFKGLLLGSVTSQVTHHADATVVVIPPRP